METIRDAGPLAHQHIPSEKTGRELATFLILLLGLCIVYSSALFLQYGFSDDYYHLYEYLHTQGASHLAISLGRPISGLIETLVYKGSRFICQLAWVRAFGLLGLATTGFLFYRIMVIAGWRRSVSMAASFSICCLPASQVYVAWASSCPSPWASTLACASVLLIATHVRRNGFVFSAMIPACVLLSLAIITYQPAAMFYWVGAAAFIFADRSSNKSPAFSTHASLKNLGKTFAIFLIVGAAALVAGFVVFKYCVRLYPELVVPTRAGMTGNPTEKMRWFVQCPLVDSLNLFNIFPTVAIAVAVGLFLLCGLIQYFSGGVLRRVVMLAIAITLVPLSFAPSLVASENFGHYRIIFALSALLLFYGWLAGMGWARTVKKVARRPLVQARYILPVIIAICAGIMASCTVTRYFTWPQSVELSLLRYKLTEPEARAAKRIILLTPSDDDSSAGWGAGRSQERDEFAQPSLYPSWSHMPTIYLVRHDIDPSLPTVPVESTPEVTGSDAQKRPAGTVIVDMRGLSRLHLSGK